MTIRPVDLNGMIQRTADVGIVKKQEDVKPLMDQQNIQVQVNKREDELAHVVSQADDSELLHNNLDAKDEGKGKYSSSSKKQNKKAKQDKVIKKGENVSFDIKI